MSANQELFEFKFYEWEEKFKDKPYLKQPFGDEWEEYTWGEVGDMARRLATGLRSLGLRDCLLYTSPSPRDRTRSRMPSSA